MTTDVVGIFDSELRQILDGAYPIKLAVNDQSKPMEHPLETGSTITDHLVRQPLRIDMSAILNSASYRDIYSSFSDRYLRGDLFTIQSKTATYDNMLIIAMPHDEDPNMSSTIAMAISFQRVQFVGAAKETFIPKDPKNSKTVSRGQQASAEVAAESPRKSSILSRIFK